VDRIKIHFFGIPLSADKDRAKQKH